MESCNGWNNLSKESIMALFFDYVLFFFLVTKSWGRSWFCFSREGTMHENNGWGPVFFGKCCSQKVLFFFEQSRTGSEINAWYLFVSLMLQNIVTGITFRKCQTAVQTWFRLLCMSPLRFNMTFKLQFTLSACRKLENMSLTKTEANIVKVKSKGHQDH